MKRKALFFNILSLLLPVFFAFAQEGVETLHLSLADCLRLALAGNVKLAARDYAIEGAGWRRRETAVRLWPVIDFSNRSAPAPRDAINSASAFFQGDLTYFNATKLGVGLPLYAFGQLGTVQKLALKGFQAAKEEKVKDEIKLHSDVVQLYYGILLSQDMRSLIQDAIVKIDNQLKKEEESHSHSPYEILKLKVFQLEMKKRLDETQTKGELAKGVLRVQLGLSPDQPFSLKSAHLEPVVYDFKPLEDFRALALEARPDSNLVDIGVEVKRLEYELEKRKLFPKIGFGGFMEVGRTTSTVRNVGSTDAYNNPFNYMRAGVGLEIKGQFDFHGAHSRVKRLDSEYQKAVLEKSLAKSGIQLEVEEAYQEAKRLKENVARAEEKQKMARQMTFLSKSNLEIGVGQEQEYTDALQLLLLSRSEYLKAVFDYNVASAKLDEKIGRRETHD